MRGKPDIGGAKVASFLDRGASAQAATDGAPPPAPPARITKTIRIDPALDAALKHSAFARWQATGERVSESDLVDEALRQYLKL